MACIGMYVCLSVCLYVCLSVCLYVCMYEWRSWGTSPLPPTNQIFGWGPVGLSLETHLITRADAWTKSKLTFGGSTPPILFCCIARQPHAMTIRKPWGPVEVWALIPTTVGEANEDGWIWLHGDSPCRGLGMVHACGCETVQNPCRHVYVNAAFNVVLSHCTEHLAPSSQRNFF